MNRPMMAKPSKPINMPITVITHPADLPFSARFWGKVRNTLPAITIALGYSAFYFRLTRTSMLEVLEQDYIRTARAKGVKENTVFYKHALRNAMLPIVTQIGTDLGVLVSGAVLTETVFAWPGLGKLAFDAMVQRDYPVIYGVFFVITVSVVLATFITDIVLAYLDPRIRYR